MQSFRVNVKAPVRGLGRRKLFSFLHFPWVPGAPSPGEDNLVQATCCVRRVTVGGTWPRAGKPQLTQANRICMCPSLRSRCRCNRIFGTPPVLSLYVDVGIWRFTVRCFSHLPQFWPITEFLRMYWVKFSTYIILKQNAVTLIIFELVEEGEHIVVTMPHTLKVWIHLCLISIRV